MVAESSPKLATNIIFTTVFVSLLRVNYRFLRLRLRHSYPQPRSATDEYPSFAGHLWWTIHNVFIYLSQTRSSIEHTRKQTIIL